MNNILINLISNFSTKHGSSFLLSIGTFFMYIFQIIGNFFTWLFGIFQGLIWVIVKLVLGIIDMFEYVVDTFLGVDTTFKDYENLINMIGQQNAGIIQKIVTTFRSIVGISIVLMIVFTIYAMIKQEYKTATTGFLGTKKDGGSTVSNNKTEFFKKLLKNIVMITVLPLTIVLGFTGVSAILSSFNRAINIDRVTVAGQVLATATYDANKFRAYANANQRVPIIIKAYSDDIIKPGDEAKAAFQISGIETQNKLRNTALNFTNSSFLSFKQSVVYKNNKFYNSDRFGDYYESFICTAEQYQVMADFVDYAQKRGINYYIKATTDKQVDWSYVTSTIYNETDHSLKIKYYDPNETYATNNYEITYVPANEATSPISDALKTISALLGIGDYGDNLYNAMERDEDSLNVVYWAREKALLKFSSNAVSSGSINYSNQENWLDTDQIIFYEFNHFKHNNTLAGHILEDFIEGVEIDVQQLVYRDYVEEVNMFTEDKYIDFVTINGSRYLVEKSESESDKQGHLYYKLVSYEDSDFLVSPSEYQVKVTKNDDESQIKLSENFDINKPTTWKLGDQILVYEYYSNPKYTNNLLEYSFGDFVYSASPGVKLPTYTIETTIPQRDADGRLVRGADGKILKDDKKTGTYFLLGGRYYNTSIWSGSPTGNFLANSHTQTTYYNYELDLNDTSKEGGSWDVVTGSLTECTTANTSADILKKYENLDKKLTFSKNFKFNNVSTWSYRDAFIMKLLSDGKLGSTTIDLINNIGVQGTLCLSGSTYYYKIAGTSNYIYADTILNVSDLNIYNNIDTEATFLSTDFAVLGEVFDVSVETETSKKSKDGTTYKFTFSDNFNRDDEKRSNWTVGDVLLYLFSKEGVIDDLDYLESHGYGALSLDGQTYLFGTYAFLSVETSSCNYYEVKFGDSELQINGNEIKDNEFLSTWNANAQTYFGISLDGDISIGSLRGNTNFERLVSEKRYSPAALDDGAKDATISFSSGFDASDFSSWTKSDFILYMYCVENNKPLTAQTLKNYSIITINKKDGDEYEWKGNSAAYNVVEMGDPISRPEKCHYFDYETLKVLKTQKMGEFIFKTNPQNTITCTPSDSVSFTKNAATDIYFQFAHESVYEQSNFEYTNKYYYSGFDKMYNPTETEDKTFKDTYLADTTLVNDYLSADSATAQIDLTLSESFDPADPASWTLLDTILVYEFMQKNSLYGVKTLAEFKTIDYFVDYVKLVYNEGTGTEKVYCVALIGNTYYKFMIKDAEHSYSTTLEDVLNAVPETKPTYEKNNTDATSVTYENINFAVNDFNLAEAFNNNNSSKLIKYIPQDNNIFSMVDTSNSNTTIYRTVDSNTKDVYQFSSTTHVIDSYGPLVRRVSWPEKLMTDMNIMYPDLNWGTLLATNSWVDTLGDYVSAYADGQFISEGNSSNTTAAGLVLSEFLLSHVEKVPYSFAGHEYSSIFDEETINALMLSLMGEQNYHELVSQAEIFVEMFNNTFAPVIEDIAKADGIKILEGKVENFELCVYKAFLATTVLSSDFGEYLFKIATRVYAQYTIYESLARAAGDYASYYAYTNGYTDVNGNLIDVFKYGTFQQLVETENKTCGNSTPTFTFNIRKAGEKLHSEGKIATTSYTFSNVNSALYSKYYSQYIEGSTPIPDSDPCYCFLYDVYFSICNEIGIKDERSSKYPSYLALFRDYLNGNVKRWSVISEVGIDGASQNFPKYEKLESSLSSSKSLASTAYVLFKYGLTIDTEKQKEEGEDENVFQKAQDEASRFNSIYDLVKRLFCGEGFLEDMTPEKLLKWIKGDGNENEVFCKDGDTNHPLGQVFGNVFTYNLDPVSLNCLLYVFKQSEDGKILLQDYSEERIQQAWQKLKELSSNLNVLASALSLAIEGNGSEVDFNGTTTIGGEKKIISQTIKIDLDNHSKKVYEDALKKLSNYQNYIDLYISSQTALDQAKKASITFTLAQFGESYKTSGYVFSVDNKPYTLTATSSPTRLAEYVYGGAFLAKYNIAPIYTDVDFNGVISQSRTYQDGEVKIDLGMWTKLRTFASRLAQYTARLFYQTNYVDMAATVQNGVYLTDNIDGTTPETLIINWLYNGATGTDISGTHARIDLETLNRLTNERTGDIHTQFQEIITYLTVSEEQGKTISEDALVLSKTTTIEEFKAQLMQKVINYEKNENETAAENVNRYLTLFYMLNMRFDYNADGESLGTTIRPVDVVRTGTSIQYKAPDGTVSTNLSVSFKIDTSSKDTVLTLAGLENRPVEELVGLEYDSLYDRNGFYDEAWGDVFVICAYDESTAKYYPILMQSENRDASGNRLSSDIDNKEKTINMKTETYYTHYLNHYSNQGIKDKQFPTPTTSYYAGTFPIIAKGIVNNAGRPTAIKTENGEVVYYRTDITAAASLSPDALYAVSSASEVSTIGFTKYVESSSYKKLSGNAKQVMFIGSSDIKTYINSSSTVYFLQDNIEYRLGASDDYGGICVLDQFQAYYTLAGQTTFLLWLGILSIFPLMFRACAAVLRRVLDIAFLTLTGPLVISLSTIGESNSKAFKAWKDMVAKTMLAAFGYLIGFNVFYMLTTSLLTMDFVSEVTISKIEMIGGFSFVSHGKINALLKYIFLIVATSIIHTSAKMLTTVVSNGKIKDPFASAVDGSDPVEGIKKVIDSVKDTANKIGSVFSGKALVELKDVAIQTAKNMIPGAQIAASAIKTGKKIGHKIAGKVTEKALIGSGVPPQVAKEAGKQMTKQLNDQMNQKEANQVKNANHFMQQYVNKQAPEFKSTSTFGETVKKEVGELPSFRKAFKSTVGGKNGGGKPKDKSAPKPSNKKDNGKKPKDKK